MDRLWTAIQILELLPETMTIPLSNYLARQRKDREAAVAYRNEEERNN